MDKTLLNIKIVITSASLLITSTSVYANTYHLTPLDSLGNESGYINNVYDINNKRQLIGYSHPTDDFRQGRAFFWNYDNGMQDLGTLDNTTGNSYARGINDLGQVVGSSDSRAFIWDRKNGMQDLGSLGNTTGNTYARSINDLGQVVGSSDSRAFIWDRKNGMQDLGTLTTNGYSFTTGINNKGQVVGRSASSGNTRSHAYIWDSENGMQDLGTLGNTTGKSYAYSINDLGQVVGSSDVNNDHHAFIWDSENGMQELGSLVSDTRYVSTSSSAKDINHAGQVVGSSDIGSSNPYYLANGNHGFIWDSENGMQDLNDLLLPKFRHWTVASADKINDRGDILALAKIPNGDYQDVILTVGPVPEPSTYAMFAAGLGLMGFVARRRKKLN